MAIYSKETPSSEVPQEVLNSIEGKVDESSRNVPNGFAGLNAQSEIGGIIVHRTDTLANLASVVLNQGELAKATDTNEWYEGDGVSLGGNLMVLSPFSGDITFDESGTNDLVINDGSVDTGFEEIVTEGVLLSSSLVSKVGEYGFTALDADSILGDGEYLMRWTSGYNILETSLLTRQQVDVGGTNIDEFTIDSSSEINFAEVGDTFDIIIDVVATPSNTLVNTLEIPTLGQGSSNGVLTSIYYPLGTLIGVGKLSVGEFARGEYIAVQTDTGHTMFVSKVYEQVGNDKIEFYYDPSLPSGMTASNWAISKIVNKVSSGFGKFHLGIDCGKTLKVSGSIDTPTINTSSITGISDMHISGLSCSSMTTLLSRYSNNYISTPSRGGIVLLDTRFGTDVTFTLPEAPTGREIRIRRMGNAAYTATVVAAGTDTIEDASSITLALGESVYLVYYSSTKTWYSL